MRHARATLPIATVAAITCALASALPLLADEPPKPPKVEAKLEGGLQVEAEIHFNRNAIKGSLPLGDQLIALTEAGTMLRFEYPSLRLASERHGLEGVTCLGLGEGGAPIAGLSDGRICRVDPNTLELTDMAKLPEPPQWLGWCGPREGRPAGLVAVTERRRIVKTEKGTRNPRHSVVHDLAVDRTIELDDLMTTFLIDRDGRLWLGADNGEWGGLVSRIDLVKGTPSKLEPPPSLKPGRKPYWSGVYGFAELRDGQVWAFGGTEHMGGCEAIITRVDGDAPSTLFQNEQFLGTGKKPDESRAWLPVNFIVDEGDSLLVVSYSDIYRVDRALKDWKKVASLDISYRWGRPDAMGSYAAVVGLHAPRHRGEPLVLTTTLDGLLRLDGDKMTRHAAPPPLGASDVSLVLGTPDGVFAMEDKDEPDDEGPGSYGVNPWRLGPDGWRQISAEPPFEVDPADEAAKANPVDSWHGCIVRVAANGSVYSVAGTVDIPGTRTTSRIVGDGVERIGREVSHLYPLSTFATPDGTLWNAFDGALKRFDDGRWKAVAPLDPAGVPMRLRALDVGGPPWFLLSRVKGRLWSLDPGANGKGASLKEFSIQEGNNPIRIFAAAPWKDGTLILATPAGLRTYVLADGTLGRPALPVEAPITSLARDGLGRLWLGGEQGLFILEPDARSLASLASVPYLGRGGIKSLARDPAHPDGILAALGPRGVAFIRAVRKP
ncbi:hypothetical protein [Singulisphaera sp. PoT]|uniref:hypothetical protein n=1 Tax=Singulisphaera sp. PoT TaxID=3411797 RepID=UPI003BF56936